MPERRIHIGIKYSYSNLNNPITSQSVILANDLCQPSVRSHQSGAALSFGCINAIVDTLAHTYKL